MTDLTVISNFRIFLFSIWDLVIINDASVGFGVITNLVTIRIAHDDMRCNPPDMFADGQIF